MTDFNTDEREHGWNVPLVFEEAVSAEINPVHTEEGWCGGVRLHSVLSFQRRVR